jgi:hypothetical protein
MYGITYNNFVLCTDGLWRHQGFADNPHTFCSKKMAREFWYKSHQNTTLKPEFKVI